MFDRKIGGRNSIIMLAISVACALILFVAPPNGVEGALIRGHGSAEATVTVLNISDPMTADILQGFNRTLADIIIRNRTQHSAHHPNQITNENAADESDADEQSNGRTQMLMSSIQNYTRNRETPIEDDTATSALCFYPRCSRPKDNSSWYQSNTAKLNFAVTIFNTLDMNIRLHSAVLRLFQLENTTANEGDCGEPVDLIVVNISVMIKHKHISEHRYKKHLCESRTLPLRGGKWVELDVRQVVRHWLKEFQFTVHSRTTTHYEPYLLIDVRDQNDNVLKASDIFQSCTEACNSAAIPWNVYNHESQELDVPTVPRLDIVYSYAPPATNNDQSATRSHRLYNSYASRFQRLSQVESQRLTGGRFGPIDMQVESTSSTSYSTYPAPPSVVDPAAISSLADDHNGRQHRHHRRRVHHRRHGHHNHEDATPAGPIA